MSPVIARHIASRFGMAKVFTVVNIMGNLASQVYKRSTVTSAESDSPIHQMQEDGKVNWIVLGENDRIHDLTNSYFKVITQPNGDIYLKLIDIFRHKEGAAESYQANPADDSVDSSPNYHHEHE